MKRTASNWIETIPGAPEHVRAFNSAINEGRLSDLPMDNNYAGNYMYMGRYNGKDQFKNSLTREYIA